MYAFVPLSATYVQIKLLRIYLLIIRDLKEYDNDDKLMCISNDEK